MQHPGGHRSCESPPPPLAPQHGRLHHTTTTSTHTDLRARSTTQVDSSSGSGTSNHVSAALCYLSCFHAQAGLLRACGRRGYVC